VRQSWCRSTTARMRFRCGFLTSSPIVESSGVDRTKTRIGRLKIRVDRVIYTTITLLSVLIIFDGWEQLQFWGVVVVILGPIVAIF
jgi:hypothetical protein